MTLSEKIFGSAIGAFISYGKTTTGALKALAVNDDGEVKIAEITANIDPAPTPVSVSFASTDAQTIIAAPSAGYRIRITKLWLSCSANFIIQLISGSTTIGNLYGMGVDMDFLQPLTLNAAEAFKLDSNIATQTYGGVCYYVEAV